MRFLLASALVLSACNVYANEGATLRNGHLVDDAGMALYTFKKDTPSSSACYDACATAWPPFLVKGEAKPAAGWSVTVRKDGTRQWAYKGAPLYYFAGDARPGDANGDGSGGVWSLVRNGTKAAETSSGYKY